MLRALAVGGNATLIRDAGQHPVEALVGRQSWVHGLLPGPAAPLALELNGLLHSDLADSPSAYGREKHPLHRPSGVALLPFASSLWRPLLPESSFANDLSARARELLSTRRACPLFSFLSAWPSVNLPYTF